MGTQDNVALLRLGYSGCRGTPTIDYREGAFAREFGLRMLFSDGMGPWVVPADSNSYRDHVRLLWETNRSRAWANVAAAGQDKTAGAHGCMLTLGWLPDLYRGPAASAAGRRRGGVDSGLHRPYGRSRALTEHSSACTGRTRPRARAEGRPVFRKTSGNSV
jgi:hypothetical protein